MKIQEPYKWADEIAAGMVVSTLIVCIFACLFLFRGEPDLIDAIIHHLMK